jgi:hypothetical protein
MTIEIVNVRNDRKFGDRPNEIYVGRRTGRFQEHTLGNPFRISKSQNREQVIVQYRVRAVRMIEYAGSFMPDPVATSFIEALSELRELEEAHGTIRLGCWCHPQACHADVIKEMIEQGGLQLSQVFYPIRWGMNHES